VQSPRFRPPRTSVWQRPDDFMRKMELNPYTKEAYFSSRMVEDPARSRLWAVLCEYLLRDIPPGATVLELGGGHCHFINNVRAAEKHVVDVYEGIRTAAAPDVRTHVQSCTNLESFRSSSIDTVFASNVFEHLTREQLSLTLGEVLRVLRPGGKLLIIQPNFKYAYRNYFDDYTHIQVFTEESLKDLLAVSGFQPERVVARFLPFSLKNAGPKWPWLMRLYLALPWRPMGGQMYIVARKGEEC
jgi:SAM-dependent methyltransferase